ncbi:MAG: acyl carrier protein [Catenulispora sp.]
MQDKVHAIWADKLALADFSDDEDFFALGGHSLIMVRIQDALAAEFGVEVPMDDLFRHATVASVAKYLQGVLQDA